MQQRRVQLDFDPVWEMLGGCVDEYVPACDEEKSFVAKEEKSTGAGQQLVTVESGNSGGSEEDGFGHERLSLN